MQFSLTSIKLLAFIAVSLQHVLTASIPNDNLKRADAIIGVIGGAEPNEMLKRADGTLHFKQFEKTPTSSTAVIGSAEPNEMLKRADPIVGGAEPNEMLKRAEEHAVLATAKE
ncbi:hypothetical protein C8J56DRAFT_1026519, partial [Mycena floridula]